MSWENDEEFITAYNNFTCEYIPEQIELAYHFWKLSRQSIVVKLSDLPEASYGTSGTCYVSHVEDRLDDAGVKYE